MLGIPPLGGERERERERKRERERGEFERVVYSQLVFEDLLHVHGTQYNCVCVCVCTLKILND